MVVLGKKSVNCKNSTNKKAYHALFREEVIYKLYQGKVKI